MAYRKSVKFYGAPATTGRGGFLLSARPGARVHGSLLASNLFAR